MQKSKVTVEELRKEVPQIIKKRPVGRLAVNKNYYNPILTQEVKSWQS